MNYLSSVRTDVLNDKDTGIFNSSHIADSCFWAIVVERCFWAVVYDINKKNGGWHLYIYDGECYFNPGIFTLFLDWTILLCGVLITLFRPHNIRIFIFYHVIVLDILIDMLLYNIYSNFAQYLYDSFTYTLFQCYYIRETGCHHFLVHLRIGQLLYTKLDLFPIG